MNSSKGIHGMLLTLIGLSLLLFPAAAHGRADAG